MPPLSHVPIGAAVVVGGLRYLPADQVRGSQRVDLAGVATLSASLLLLVLPLILGRAEGWPVWVCLATSVPIFGLFLATQRREAVRGGNPLLNLHIVRRPAITWGLLSLLTATGTYYTLLFTVAQYLQQGLGRSALFSGLVLLPWVVLFGFAGQLTGRLPARLGPLVPGAGYLLMAGAYLVLSVALLTGHLPDLLLLVLLGVGGLGLGSGFNTLLAHLTGAVPSRYAPDISGVSTTTLQISGALGVAAFGTLYLGLASHPGSAQATHAFAITNLALAGTALIAAASAYLATHVGTAVDGDAE